MTTLEMLGYKLEGDSYCKYLDNYKIILLPSGNEFIRRIIKDNRVIDIRKVSFSNIEGDKAFLEALRERAQNVSHKQAVLDSHVETVKEAIREIHLTEIKEERPILEEEVHLKKEVI